MTTETNTDNASEAKRLLNTAAGWVALGSIVLFVIGYFLSVVRDIPDNKQKNMDAYNIAEIQRGRNEELKILADAGALPGQQPKSARRAQQTSDEMEIRPDLNARVYGILVGARYVFPDGNGRHVSNISFKDLPRHIDGQFMLEASDGTRAWTDDWSSDQSPIPIAEFIGIHHEMGWNSVLRIYTQGPVTFRF